MSYKVSNSQKVSNGKEKRPSISWQEDEGNGTLGVEKNPRSYIGSVFSAGETSWDLSLSSSSSDVSDIEIRNLSDIDLESEDFDLVSDSVISLPTQFMSDMSLLQKVKKGGAISHPTPKELEEDTWNHTGSFKEYVDYLYRLCGIPLLAVPEKEFLYEVMQDRYRRGTDDQEASSDWDALSKLPDPWAEGRYITPVFHRKRSIVENEELTVNTLASGLRNLTKPPEEHQMACTKLLNSFVGVRSITILSQYQFLQYVDLSHNDIHDLRPLWNIPHLVYLDVSYNNVSHENFGLPVAPQFLTYLNLSFNSFKAIPEGVNMFWALIDLNISNNKIEVIQNLDKLEYLQYLNLSENKIERVLAIHNINLKTLNLSTNNIHLWRSGVSRNLNNLQELNLSYNKMRTLLPFKYFIALQILDISFNMISETKEIIHLRSLHQLRDLSLEGNSIDMDLSFLRSFAIFNIPKLAVFNRIGVTPSEKVSAMNMYSLNEAEMARSSEANWFLREQSLGQPEACERLKPVGCHPALVVLIGFNGCDRELVIRESLRLTYNKAKILVQKTTRPLRYPTEELAIANKELYEHISEAEFCNTDEDGGFLMTELIMGHKYGVPTSEAYDLEKVLVMPCSMAGGFQLYHQGYRPFYVLMIPQNDQLLKERLSLWTSHTVSIRVKDFRKSGKESSYSIPVVKDSLTLYQDKMKMHSNPIGPLEDRKNEDEPCTKEPFREPWCDGLEEESSESVYPSCEEDEEFSDFYDFPEAISTERYFKYFFDLKEAYINYHLENPGMFWTYISSDCYETAAGKLNEVIEEAYSRLVEFNRKSFLRDPPLSDPLIEKNVLARLKGHYKELSMDHITSPLT